MLLSLAATATAGNLSFSIVKPGDPIDLGNVPLLGWFTRITGHVFVDNNANGKRDPGEPGVPNFDVTMKNRRNDMMVSGQNVSTTNFTGEYAIKEGYPMGAFIIEEFFNTRYKTTGVTYQADNDPQEHTTLTAAVDLSVNPIIGQDGRVDIGVLPYDAEATPCDDSCQGGIVATVAYDATRNELQARKAATEDYEPGIPGITVQLAMAVPCTTTCDSSGRYEINPDGSFASVPVSVGDDPTVNDAAEGNMTPGSADYLTETWTRPAGCVPRDSEGRPVIQDAIRNSNNPADRTEGDCVEATMLGTTFAFADGDIGAADGQSVDGNYGFVTWHAGDYIVGLDIPTDPIFNRPLYKVRDEDPINVFTGDVYVPQGADVTGMVFNDFLKANRYDPTVPQLPAVGLREPASTTSPYPNATCVGPLATVDADPSDPDLHNVGGSPYEGLQAPSCQYKLIHVEAGQSVAPNFLLYTDVPIPAKYYGYVTDDVSVSTDRRDRPRRGAGHRQRPGGSLRLDEPSAHGDRHRLQRPVRGAHALDEQLQLPGAGGPVCGHVPLRGQRPRPAATAEPQLQLGVPHHRGELPGVARHLHRGRHRAHTRRGPDRGPGLAVLGHRGLQGRRH